jgi:hypothetical protein
MNVCMNKKALGRRGIDFQLTGYQRPPGLPARNDGSIAVALPSPHPGA